MDQHSTDTPERRWRSGRNLRSGLVAAGAALGMTLAGLGIAAAQTSATDETTTTEATTGAAPEATTGSAPATTAEAIPAPEGDAPSLGAPTEAGRRGLGPGRHGMKGAGLAAAAQAIGITEEELVTALRDGQSMAQVAESKGVAVQAVIEALVAQAKAHLAEHVAAGDLTQAEADERAAALTERITEMVDRVGTGPGGPGRHRHGPGGQAPAGEGADGAPASLITA